MQSRDAAGRPRQASESPGTVGRDPLLLSESITATRIVVILSGTLPLMKYSSIHHLIQSSQWLFEGCSVPLIP